MKSSTERYGKIPVLIHWLSAILILILLGTGFGAGFSTDPALKTQALQIHVPVAIAVLLLTAFRLVWWWRLDKKPAPVGGLPKWQLRTASWTHRGLYALILLLLVSGISMSILSGLPDALFGASPLPDLDSLPPRTAHGVLARLLAALVILHIAAALQHHFFKKDDTLRRMWFETK